MSDVGRGVKEIRIHVLGEWRVLYVAAFAEAVYVLHCFQKKTAKTRHHDLSLPDNATELSKVNNDDYGKQDHDHAVMFFWIWDFPPMRLRFWRCGI